VCQVFLGTRDTGQEEKEQNVCLHRPYAPVGTDTPSVILPSAVEEAKVARYRRVSSLEWGVQDLLKEKMTREHQLGGGNQVPGYLKEECSRQRKHVQRS
jgi:hypothetical protein